MSWKQTLMLHATLVLIALTPGFAQRCGCPDWSHFEGETFLCKPVRLSNGARVFRRIGCDSTWLMFRSPAGRPRTLQIHEFPELTGRIGASFAFENERTFTLRHRVISGCCAAEEYSLHDKRTGRLIKDLGPCIWLSENRDFNFLVRFADERQNSLLLQFLDTALQVRIPLPPNWQTRIPGSATQAELAFYDPQISGNVFTIAYRYSPRDTAANPKTDTIRYQLPRH